MFNLAVVAEATQKGIDNLITTKTKIIFFIILAVIILTIIIFNKIKKSILKARYNKYNRKSIENNKNNK